jgi:hypothetical protein
MNLRFNIGWVCVRQVAQTHEFTASLIVRGIIVGAALADITANRTVGKGIK